MAGRPTAPVPHRLAPAVGQAFRRAGLADFSPEQMRFLAFGRVLDTTRMRSVLGLEPRFTTREAFEDFVRGRGLRDAGVARLLERVEHRALGLLERLASMIPAGASR